MTTPHSHSGPSLLDLCMLLQDTIRANRFKGSLDGTDGLVARYIFTADNIQEGRTDANGLKKVRALHSNLCVRHWELCVQHVAVMACTCVVSSRRGNLCLLCTGNQNSIRVGVQHFSWFLCGSGHLHAVITCHSCWVPTLVLPSICFSKLQCTHVDLTTRG